MKKEMYWIQKGKKNVFLLQSLFLFSVFLVLWGTGFSKEELVKESSILKPFTTDGCSLFPDGTFSDKEKWQDCCIEHDIAYWQGGSEAERLKADLELKRCIFERTGDQVLSDLVYDSVRIWGSPVFPAWYRWGYGWPYGRGYEALNKEEQEQVTQHLREYYEEGKTKK